MAKEVILPKFGFTQEGSQIVAWLKQAGDWVEVGEPLVEVTTDKVNMEVEAPATGRLAGIRAQVGDSVPVTEVIAYILEPGETLPPTAVGPAASRPATATPVATRFAQVNNIDLGQVPGSGAGGKITRQDVASYLTQQPVANSGKVRATPAARRVAREQGVELTAVTGSGPHGRIQAHDVIAKAPSPASHPSTPTARRVPFTNMRRTIARTMQRSMQETPHVTFQADVEMTAVEQFINRANQLLPADAVSVSLTAVVTKAVGWTLQRHPRLNSRLGNDELWLLEEINIGVAVALEDGLIVPVVTAVPHKGIAQIADEIKELAGRARSGKLRPRDLADGTFTISNLGMYGIDRFTAIINPPQVAILAVGRVVRQFVPNANDQPVVRPICTLTLSADHRVVDGAVAAQFMADLRQVLEHPEMMLL